MSRHDVASVRIFQPAPLAKDRAIGLEHEAAHYLIKVLRMGEGAKLLVFNGQDGEWEAELRLPSRKTPALELLRQTRPQTGLSRLNYAFAPLKSARLDYVIQKAVEMGAGCIIPVITQRCQVSRLKAERLRANAIEAAEQCGILSLPEIAPEITLKAWLDGLDAAHPIVFCDEDAPIRDPVSALQLLPKTGPISVLIGPEGGFAPEERAHLLRHQTIARLSLGPRILRADTAGVAALALLQAVIGDWK
jgi:16S rRNA (uracil1498-N3)-methyltransferase